MHFSNWKVEQFGASYLIYLKVALGVPPVERGCQQYVDIYGEKDTARRPPVTAKNPQSVLTNSILSIRECYEKYQDRLRLRIE